MRQYFDAKRQYRHALLFFRMGDFYEMFYEDALVASRALDLTLTSRSKDASGTAVPMCGVPFHAADGYIAGVLTLTSADPATASPDRACEAIRLGPVVRSAGGAAADPVWGFPLPAHCDGLSPEELLEYWDAYQGGKSREHLLRQLVLAVRVWRPDVIVTDAIDPAAPTADRVMLFAAREAFKLAADPTAFPEQIEHLGLAPHTAKKLYAWTPDATGAQVKLDAAAFRPDLIAGSVPDNLRQKFMQATKQLKR